MDLKAQQERLDSIKWQDSLIAGCDTCGSYAFCSVCNKEEEYPCANAEARYKKGRLRMATVHFKIGNND